MKDKNGHLRREVNVSTSNLRNIKTGDAENFGSLYGENNKPLCITQNKTKLILCKNRLTKLSIDIKYVSIEFK